MSREGIDKLITQQGIAHCDVTRILVLFFVTSLAEDRTASAQNTYSSESAVNLSVLIVPGRTSLLFLTV